MKAEGLIIRAILNKFCQCETRDNIEIHLQLQKQHNLSRLASRLQNYMKQQEGFKKEQVQTYGPFEIATLIKEYAHINFKRILKGIFALQTYMTFPCSYE